MKRKVGKLHNKPIVIGNPNKITKNEINYKDLASSDTVDNLKKVERAFLLKDMNSDTFDGSGFGLFMSSNYQMFNTCITGDYDISLTYNYVSSTLSPKRILGFTIHQLVLDRVEIPYDDLLKYFVEVPIDEYYNLGKQKRVFVLPKNSQQLIQEITKILDSFNLKDGEIKNLEGYLIPSGCVADEVTVLFKVRRDGNKYFVLSGIRNMQPEADYYLDEIYS